MPLDGLTERRLDPVQIDNLDLPTGRELLDLLPDARDDQIVQRRRP